MPQRGRGGQRCEFLMEPSNKNPRLKRLAAVCLLAVFCLQMWVPVQASSSTAATDSSAPPSSGASSLPQEDPFADILAEPGGGLYRPDYVPQAEAWTVYNVNTGLFVAEKNADAPLETASLVKLMTCILVMEHMDNFGKDIATTKVSTAGKQWVYDELFGKNASIADIRLGETLTVEELLYAALLPSGNEAALILADYVSGGYMRNFLYLMNTHAKSLGCTVTYFDDACGLSEYNVTSARDMALIMKDFMRYPALSQIAGASTFEIQAHERHDAPYTIHTTNRLLVKTSPYYSLFPAMAGTVQAGKTGSLGEWQNLVLQADKEGTTFITVVLHSPDAADTLAAEMVPPSKPRPALVESAGLLDWAFRKLSVASALDMEQPVTEIRVLHSTQQDAIKLMPDEDIKVVLQEDAGDEVLKRKYNLPQEVEAPVQAGTVLGDVTLFIGQVEIGSARLSAATSVHRNDTLLVVNKTKDFVGSTFLKVFAVLTLILGSLYAGAIWLANNSRARKKQARSRPSAPSTQKPQKRGK